MLVFSHLNAQTEKIVIGGRNIWSGSLHRNTTLVERYGTTAVTVGYNELSYDEKSVALFHLNKPEQYESTGHYRIITHPSYSNDEMQFGGGSAFFDGRTPLVARPVISANGNDPPPLSDFSIEFMVKPFYLLPGELLFRLKGERNLFKEESEQTILCYVDNHRIVWRIEGAFSGSEDISPSVELKSDPLLPERWYHVHISYNSSNGMAELCIDRQPHDIQYAYENKSGKVLPPVLGSYEEFTVTLGERFHGLIDELHISRNLSHEMEPFKGRYHKEGEFLSKVIDLEITDSTISKIDIEEFDVNSNRLLYYYHIANDPVSVFGVRDTFEDGYGREDIWTAFIPGEPLVQNNAGRYLLLKVLFLSDPKAISPPLIATMTVHYRNPVKPPLPLDIYAEYNDGTIKIGWTPKEPAEGIGYLIYIGEATGEYFYTDRPVDAGENPFAVIDVEERNLYFIRIVPYRRGDHPLMGIPSKEIVFRAIPGERISLS